MRKTLRILAGSAAVAFALAGCGGGGNVGGCGSASGTISYWLWDANQQPAYQACADAFATANPGLKVKITQRGWDDYWSTLTTGFVSHTAPDVFTDHLSKYPEFANQKQLLSLDDAVAKDKINVNGFVPGLADLWVGQDGKRYGLPKDWDTVAMFYNKRMATGAGVTEAQMNNLNWNPQDGGTFEQVVAKLTVDKNGKHGDQAGFDKNHVAVYGLGLPGSGGANGQTEYSWFTGTTGWTHTDKNPWGTKYNFDDPKFQESIKWWAGLAKKGYMPTLESTVGASMNDAFGAGKNAINVNGSWMIGTYTGYQGIELGTAPTPIGPSGKRASMFNGLADSIYAGTKKKDNAIKWVEFLASEDCQKLVAQKGVVFPAIPPAVDIAKGVFEQKGVNVTPFTVHLDDKTTFLFPITDNAADITAIMQPAMDAVLSGKKDVSSLTQANKQINALFN